MIHTGLVSISFRKYTAEEIAAAMRKSGLTEVEWGSDVHVPVGDTERARQVRRLSEENGLHVAAYGSYYYLCGGEDFHPYLENARILGTKVIRVWGGKKGSAELTKEDWDSLVADARSIAKMAAADGITITLECHNNSVTDTADSAKRFLDAVQEPNLKTYWQPNQKYSHEANIEAAKLLSADTVNIHVFAWELCGDDLLRYPLASHADRWQEYFRVFRDTGTDHAAMLEFMPDDRIESLTEEAATLNQLVNA